MGVAADVIVTLAEPVAEELAAEMAVIVTAPGDIAGAKYSPGVHGTVSPELGQIYPTVELPPTTGAPLPVETAQDTPVFVVPCTEALN
jgi:hypothetical protein